MRAALNIVLLAALVVLLLSFCIQFGFAIRDVFHEVRSGTAEGKLGRYARNIGAAALAYLGFIVLVLLLLWHTNR
jgi:hypothetical protein